MPPSPSSDDITTTSPDQQTCPVCGTGFTRVRRQRFCSDACRKTAWARTRAVLRPEPVPVPPRGQRLAATIYACPDCDTRYHGLQWCPDCNTPCTRVGPGGPCPHCDEPVAITDLLHPAQTGEIR